MYFSKEMTLQFNPEAQNKHYLSNLISLPTPDQYKAQALR